MIREMMTQGMPKEFQRSLSIDRREGVPKNSPRYGLMAGRHSNRMPFSWIYVFGVVFLVFLTVVLVLNNTTIHSMAPSNSLNADPTSVHVAYLAIKVAELQEKVLKASTAAQATAARSADPDSLPSALAELLRERAFSRNVLVEISTGLDGIVTVLQELRKSVKENSPLSSNLDKSYDITSSDVSLLTGTKQDAHSLDLPDSDLSHSDPLYNFFEREEIRKYIKVRQNRGGAKNFMGVNATYGTIGHACVSNKPLLEKYMDYDVGEVCRDDWVIAQQLIIRGCEPLPRRRCRARSPKRYVKPLPANESLWAIPDDDSIRWDNYYCRNFSCLADWEHRKKFFKCSPCFDLQNLEKKRWVVANTTEGEFLISDVLALKPGELRIGLDYSMGTGTFAARMKEHDVTIVSATLNLGAPFSEVIALRGLVPLYISINQRLPFFDNTLDLIHTVLFLDAWIDHQLLDFIIFDFDRVLRPGGLLWLDRFFCHREELAEYLFYFKRLRYKVHMWTSIPKIDKGRNEVYFSAVWEKPHTPF
ncbi:hypothetical protein M758_1G194900 [Ceratodon purpureus]|nr:hypothetical protein M758_1G194900 [Ceratodon purpureus]